MACILKKSQFYLHTPRSLLTEWTIPAFPAEAGTHLLTCLFILMCSWSESRLWIYRLRSHQHETSSERNGDIQMAASMGKNYWQCYNALYHVIDSFVTSSRSSSYRSSRLGLSHWDPYAMHRGGCLDLYYCNMEEWCWWDSSLIWKTNWLPSVLWHCWFGHMTCENCPRYDL